MEEALSQQRKRCVYSVCTGHDLGSFKPIERNGMFFFLRSIRHQVARFITVGNTATMAIICFLMSTLKVNHRISENQERPLKRRPL